MTRQVDAFSCIEKQWLRQKINKIFIFSPPIIYFRVAQPVIRTHVISLPHRETSIYFQWNCDTSWLCPSNYPSDFRGDDKVLQYKTVSFSPSSLCLLHNCWFWAHNRAICSVSLSVSWTIFLHRLSRLSYKATANMRRDGDPKRRGLTSLSNTQERRLFCSRERFHCSERG